MHLKRPSDILPRGQYVNMLRHEQTAYHFTDNILKCIFFNIEFLYFDSTFIVTDDRSAMV